VIKQRKPVRRFVICIRNENADDLVRGKVYQLVPDKSAAHHNLARIVDESGEDYMYPAGYFSPITLPLAIKRALTIPAQPA